MNRTLNIISFLIFASALSVRAVDPVIPQIAADFVMAPSTAAYLAVGFAAYGMALPILGPIADALGKVRVMVACLLVLAISSFLCAAATGFSELLILRIIAGAACGGSFPIAMALVSDLVPMAQRQVVIARLLGGTIAGNLLGAAASGVVADAVHWRGVFVILGLISTAALALGFFGLRGLPEAPRQPLDVRSVVARYRAIFRMRTARICYLTVLSEGITLFGVFAYVAVLLRAAGEPRASIAGLVIAAFAVGGMVYSLSVRKLLRWFGQKRVMMAGGFLIAIGLGVVAWQPLWPVQCAAFGVMGLGFYMLHASIQIFVTELVPAARSSAIAFHTFSIFVGQAIGTVVFGFGLAAIGAAATLLLCAAAVALTGVIAAQLLTRPKTV